MAKPHLVALATAIDASLGYAREIIDEAWQPLMQATHSQADTEEDTEQLQKRLDQELEGASEALMLFLELLSAPQALARFTTRWASASGDMFLALDAGGMDYVACARFELIDEIFRSLVPSSAHAIALRAKQEMVREVLESTPKIVKASNQVPTSETALHAIIHQHMEATFPGYLPKAAIATSPKYYIPDGAIPTLELALEWKYVKNKKDLKRAIDEVKTDMASYGESRQFRRFFAVFYQTASSICTQQELNRAFGNPAPSWDMILVTAPLASG